MLCVGTYQLPSTDASPASAYIAGSDFFFDTRLLLRFVGCAGEAAVDAAKELVKLIQNAGGQICYYPQTLEEMDGAFEEAIDCLSNGNPPDDEEMRLYSARVNNHISVISAKRSSLRTELSKANIYLRQHEDFSETDRIRFGFDRTDLQHYMKARLRWELQTIKNDVQSIWETHMKRHGDYTEYCGTQARLPVFVTTNSRLISVALKFREKRPLVQGISGWKKNRLPIITDIRLTCRLWSPATQGKRLSLLYLTANTVAAQHPTKHYLDSIRKLAIELKENTPEYSSIPLPTFFDDNVRDSVLKHTQGLDDNLNIGAFASSIAELAEMNAKEHEELTKRFSEQTLSIIDGAVDSNKNRLTWRGLSLRLIFNWPIVVAVLFAGITALISWWSNNWKYMWLIVVILMVLKAVELLFSTDFIIKLLLGKALPRIERSFEKKIVKRLRKADLPYKDEIIKRTMEQTVLIEKARKML